MKKMMHGARVRRGAAKERPFSVSVPSDIGWHLAPFAADAPADVSGLEGPWLAVSGEGLPANLLIRVEPQDGRFVVTGLLLGLHRHTEISWQTLRDIRPASLVSQIFEDIDPDNPAAAVVASDPAPVQTVEDPETFDARAWIEGDWDDDEDPVIDIGSQQWRDHGRAMAALALWQSADRMPIGDAVAVPGARTATDLSQVAAVYTKHAAATPHRATQATADELHISRATALRRIKQCRRVGLLPPQAGDR